MKELNIQNWT